MATAHGAAASRRGEGLPSHHLDDAFLMDYAAGNTTEAVSLLIATHLALCPMCRARFAEFESLGGAMLEDLSPTPLGQGALSAVLARLDSPDDGATIVGPDPLVIGEPANDEADSAPIPQPLRSYLGRATHELDWQPVIRGLEEFELDVVGAKTKLLRIQPGASMPQHTHEGSELTLVLDGSYDDEVGHFARGDVAVLDDDHDHRPIAGPGRDCVCLTVIDAPLRLTGRFGRFLNPFVKF